MNRSFVLSAVALLALGATGCRGEVSEDPPITLIRNMHNQPKYKAQAKSTFFADGRTMRPEIEGTVSHEAYLADEELATGRTADGLDYVREVPKAAIDALGGADAMLVRGKDRFGIYCAPCHGLAGYGNGVVAQRSKLPANAGGERGFGGVANLHEAAKGYLSSPDGKIYATIANGVRTMPGYAAQIPVNDRWAIVAYVRALQLSQLSAK